MATVRKAKYIYKDGTYFEVGGDGVDQAARDAASAAQATADSKAAIDDTAPSATSVYSSDKVEQEITAAVADFVSFSEDQTSRTDAEKAQARVNIGAEKSWTLVWTNASPTSSFASQDVLIDLSAYSEVRVDVYSDTNASHLANSSGPCKVGVGGYAIYFYQQSSASTQHYQRQFFTYTNKVHFNDCRSRNTSSSSGSLGTINNACIPCRIYAR